MACRGTAQRAAEVAALYSRLLDEGRPRSVYRLAREHRIAHAKVYAALAAAGETRRMCSGAGTPRGRGEVDPSVDLAARFYVRRMNQGRPMPISDVAKACGVDAKRVRALLVERGETRRLKGAVG